MGRFANSNRQKSRMSLSSRGSALVLGWATVAGLASPAVAQETAAEHAQAAVVAETAGVPVWGLDSLLPADPAVRFGVLPNGMRYALKHNETPKGAAVIRFAFDVGMREAEAAQAGIPHFVEHMAFNGSTNIAEGELVKQLERLGLAFGADTNAETDLEHTTYKLDLPNLKPETVDGALTVMREIASELALAPAAVDRERGVLVSEYRVRNVPGLRRTIDALGKQIGDPRFGPGVTGTPESLAAITPAQLRAFYQGYYRPERATLVMVGDFDVNTMEKDVRERFSSWKGKGAELSSYVPKIAAADKATVATFSDPAVPEIIEFDRVAMYVAPANDLAQQRRETLESIASAALSNRLGALGHKADSPIILGQAVVQDVARSARSATMIVVAKDGMWQPALALGERELRRAIQYGFTPSEIAEAKANIRTALENAVTQEAGRQSAGIADELARASLSDSVYMSPAATLAMYNALESTITAEAASEAFRAAWHGGPSLVHVATKAPVAGGIAAISSALAESAKVAVTAPVEEAAKAFAYNDFGPAGRIVSDKTIDDLGIRTVRFANGVELNLKKTDFEPGKIAWYAKVGTGAQEFPADQPGLTVVTQILSSVDGLKQHDIDELRRITAGRQVGIGLSVGADAIVAAGSTTPTDLELQMKLLAAELTEHAYNPSTQAQWAGMGPVIAKNIMTDPSTLAAVAVPWIVTGNDARFGFGDPNELAARTLEDIRAAVQPQLASGGLEIGLVGDFDQDAVIAAVAKTLAALPQRAKSGAKPAAVRPVAFTSDLQPKVIYHEGAADQGTITLVWPTTDDSDLKDSLTRDLLSGVMGLRLIDVVREELGATYTPSASSFDQSTYPRIRLPRRLCAGRAGLDGCRGGRDSQDCRGFARRSSHRRRTVAGASADPRAMAAAGATERQLGGAGRRRAVTARIP